MVAWSGKSIDIPELRVKYIWLLFPAGFPKRLNPYLLDWTGSDLRKETELFPVVVGALVLIFFEAAIEEGCVDGDEVVVLVNILNDFLVLAEDLTHCEGILEQT